jgi:hypothetical protein
MQTAARNHRPRLHVNREWTRGAKPEMSFCGHFREGHQLHFFVASGVSRIIMVKIRHIMNRRHFIHTLTNLAAVTTLPVTGSAASTEKPATLADPRPKMIPRFGDGRDWFFEKRFGMFVHWGLYAMIRKLQPKAVINNRGFDEGDFGTPERDYEKDESASFDRPTEANQAVGMESWGYRKDEDYYTDRHLIRSIDRYLCRDANYLLNVGPKPDGTIPDPAVL